MKLCVKLSWRMLIKGNCTGSELLAMSALKNTLKKRNNCFGYLLVEDEFVYMQRVKNVDARWAGYSSERVALHASVKTLHDWYISNPD